MASKKYIEAILKRREEQLKLIEEQIKKVYYTKKLLKKYTIIRQDIHLLKLELKYLSKNGNEKTN